ncbi:hypothetical protein GALMADRAFT_222596 [Galerina marginata CBS 339.88]|uniref:Uncharacterized protein n=1 Tax=Galerina marginata (strain CBS 339.88) TaxID=685588 RepID=A0A067TM80_GALM3|nr:hypothetical protein GALMADRAFT_222596 [Galerina marginata CBS 339.88]
MSRQSHDESIFSPQTSDQQIVLARQRHEQQVTLFKAAVLEQQRIFAEKERALEAEKRRVQEEEAKNWVDRTGIRSQQANLENETAMVKRDKESLVNRERQIQVLEDQRRRNRTRSEAYIEDTFATLGPRAVVEKLTSPSMRERTQAMENISACIGDDQNLSPTFARFTAQDIAPDILPKLHQLVSSLTPPIDSIVVFAESVVTTTAMAKALALAGQCGRLTDYLIEENYFSSRLAISCLRRMVGMETLIVKHAYEAMALVIPQIPVPTLDEPQHPSIDFIREVAPKIVEDCFNNGLWLSVAPLVGHRITSIRQIVLRQVILLARQSDRNRHGIVEASILEVLDIYYRSSSPPPDVVDFFVELLPLVTDKLSRRPAAVQWLLKRLSDPNAGINSAVIDAFRTCLVNHDPTVFQVFTKVELLLHLDSPSIQQSSAIMKLICQGLSVLAIPYARAKAAEGIVRFLDHSDPTVASACLSSCMRIAESTLEDRTHLRTVVLKLNHAKESTLQIYDRAMPVFCKDWAAADDYIAIVHYIQNPEQRIRLPAQQVWRDVVCNSSTARSKIVRDGLLDIIFELCESQYEDAVSLGAKCCTPLAIEITKAGVTSARKLVELLNHPNVHLRQAALQGVQLALESSDGNCQVLLRADVFKALQMFFETYPKEVLENAHKVLARLSPFLRTSREACGGLVQLLESGSQTVQRAARNALTTISNTTLSNRDILRAVVLDSLELPTEPLVEYAVKAIQEWIGPDLAQLNDFPKFFALVEHSDRRLQSAALISLKQRLSDAGYQDSLEKANIISTLRSLANSDNPEALTFVTVALKALALSLARNGHASNIMDLLVHKEPKVRDGAARALEDISKGSVRDRKYLLDEDIIERLVGHGEHLEQTQTDLLASIIPILALDYLEVGKADLIFGLVDHPQQQIRTAASKSVLHMASGTAEQKASLRDALLPRLDHASPLLREVAGNCLSRSLAHDLINDGDFIRMFRMLRSEDVRVREPIIGQLRTYIQDSDETARRRLVDARILPKILDAYTPAKDDLLDFMSNCLLPVLGPSFTQDDGGAALFPLLDNDEHRLRASAIQALKNAIDSRYGSMENMAKASIIVILHQRITSDNVILELWCRILPKAAPYLTNRAEIDILFASLNDPRGDVREAASKAISVLAKTSEISRTCMLPTLLHNLENPSPTSIPSIAEAISLSGITFVSNGKEVELLHHILNDKYIEIRIAAVEATIQSLSKGGSFEHQKLVTATPDVLTVALKLHNRPSQRQHSLKLLQSIVNHLSHELLHDAKLARDMFSLFDDPDTGLSNALYQAWSTNPMVLENDMLPELLPLLFEESKVRNPSVAALLRELAPAVVNKLLSRRRLDILVDALTIKDANVVRAYLHETCLVIEESNEKEKGWFVAQPSFVSAIGKHLKGRDPTMRRHSSTIVGLLSSGSGSRSGKIMDEGIGRYLSWLAVHGGRGTQQESLHALCTLFLAAPDHAERLVTESLPALCDILDSEGLVIEVYNESLHLLHEIVQQSPHPPIIKSGIVLYMVKWLSPKYSVTDIECKTYVFQICQGIAQKSDTGRRALIEAGILPELSSLASSRMAPEVINACNILKALAHTRVFTHDIISAGLKTSMENITSPFRKSTLQSKEDKSRAQAAAKEALEMLKSSKKQEVNQLSQTPSLSRTRSSANLGADRRAPSANEEDVAQPERRANGNWGRRTVSESQAVPSFNTPLSDSQTEEPEESRPRRLHHSRSMSTPNRPVIRPQFGQLRAVEEDPVFPVSSRHTPVEEEEPDDDYISPASRQQTGHRRQFSRNHSPPPVVSSFDGPGGHFDEENDRRLTRVQSTSRTVPPSYRSNLSPSEGSVHWSPRRDQLQDATSADNDELDFDAGEMATNNLSVGPSRSQWASRSGNMRRK